MKIMILLWVLLLGGCAVPEMLEKKIFDPTETDINCQGDDKHWMKCFQAAIEACEADASIKNEEHGLQNRGGDITKIDHSDRKHDIVITCEDLR